LHLGKMTSIRGGPEPGKRRRARDRCTGKFGRKGLSWGLLKQKGKGGGGEPKKGANVLGSANLRYYIGETVFEKEKGSGGRVQESEKCPAGVAIRKR